MYKFYVSWNVHTTLFKGVKSRRMNDNDPYDGNESRFRPENSSIFFFFFERIEYKNVSKKTSKFFVHDHFTSHLSSSLIPFRDVVTRFEHRFEPQFDQRARIAFFLGYTFLCKQPYIYVHNYPPLFANLSEYYIYNMDIFETVYGTFTERKKKEKKERDDRN